MDMQSKRLFGHTAKDVKEVWNLERQYRDTLQAAVDAAINDNSKDYKEWNCEGEPYIYHGKKVDISLHCNEIGAYWCEIHDNVANTYYKIWCTERSYESTEALVIQYVKAMCQY